MPEQIQLLIALLLTVGPPVLICIVIPGSPLMALFIGLLLAVKIQWQGMKNVIQKATLVAIRDLSPQLKLVRVSGVISQIREPVDPQDPTLAMLKVQINGWKSTGGGSEHGGIWGKTKASPILIDDGSGSIWIDPRPIDSRQLGEGKQVDYEQIRQPCQILGVDVDKVTYGASGLRCLMWEWRVGQKVTVFRNLQRNNGEWTISRLKRQPMMVSPLEFDKLTEVAETNTSRMQGISWGIIVLLIVVFGCPAVGFCGWVLRTLTTPGKLGGISFSPG